MFDSNYEESLPLEIELLDLICYSLGIDVMFVMFETLLYEVNYVNTKSKLNIYE